MPDPIVAPAEPHERDAVVSLWTNCGLVRAYNPPERDFDLAQGKEGSDVLTLRLDDSIVGTVMVGHDGHRGWIYYLAVDPAFQRQGFGKQLVEAAERWLQQRHIRKCQLMVRESNAGVVGFYTGLGYDRSPVVVMQRWLDGTSPR
jgi:ribosomal protein S18 acetylase RimI-like enzyme